MIVKIFRYDPETDKKPYYQTYSLDTDNRDLTVTELLKEIAEGLDPGLTFFQHSSCNHSTCKRCYVRINGEPVLACSTVITDKKQIQIDPINPHDVVKDLVVNNL